MANNRTEAKSAVNTQMVPTISAPELRVLLNDELIDSLPFRKDIIASQAPTAGTITVSFLTEDLVTVTTAVNLAVSFSDIENGDVKYLAITKNAGNAISFSGATDISPRKLYITTDVTYVMYSVMQKNGVIVVNSINIDNDIANEITAEILSINGGLKKKLHDIGDWDMDATQTTSIEVVATIGLDPTKIRGINAYIRGDVGSTDENSLYLLGIGVNYNVAGWAYMKESLGVVKIFLQRAPGSLFDSTNFNSTSFNRGWLIIEYVE